MLMQTNKDFPYYIDKINEIDNEVYRGIGKYHQFTIDMVENIQEELESERIKTGEWVKGITTEKPLDLDTIIGSLHYGVMNALEICDQSLEDYKILQRLDAILSNKE